MKPIWFKFLNGPLYVSPERFAQLQDDPTPPAIDLFRNFKRLADTAVDHKFFASQIKNCLRPEQVVPHIYYLADRFQPFYREEIHTAFVRAKYPPFVGNLCVLIDLSRQMTFKTAAGVDQMELVACWASASNCPTKRIFTVSNTLVEVHAPVAGLGGVDKILSSQQYAACNIDHAVKDINRLEKFDQILVYSQRCFTLNNKLIMPKTATLH
jgi:hypothetical protein